MIAQGKENAERRNLSFIERASFAVGLERRGFARATIQAALAVHPAEMTRLLAVGHTVPTQVIEAIGPAPKAGRPRWMQLAALLTDHGEDALLTGLLRKPSFQQASSNARFDLCRFQKSASVVH